MKQGLEFQDSKEENFNLEIMKYQEAIMASSIMEMNLEFFAQIYCTCDENFGKLLFRGQPSLFGNDVAGVSSTNQELPLPQMNLKDNFGSQNTSNLNKEEMYFSLLKEYNYETLSYFDDKKQRQVPQYR